MPEESTEDLTRWILAAAGFVLGGGLLGYLKFWVDAKQAPAVNALTLAQADTEHAKGEQIRKASALDELKLLLAELRLDIVRLRGERDEARKERDEALRHAGAAEIDKERAEAQMRASEALVERMDKFLKDQGLMFPH